MNRAAMLLLAGAVGAMAYVPDFMDLPLHRADYAGIQFLANQNIAAGMTHADGTVWITADSAPMDAINGAVAAWNGVATTAAHFLPVQTTTLSYNPNDDNQVIVFADDSYTRSFTNGILAITAVGYNVVKASDGSASAGTIVDTDIFFSPFFQFSTTGAPGTYDLQSVLSHELGHALGSNHTNILSATMYFTTAAQDSHGQILSSDDVACISVLYPPAEGNGYGTISGVTTVAGAPLLGGVMTAVDPNTGITVGGFSSVTDGSFSFQVPPGNYYVYVEPAANISLYYFNSQTVVFTYFQSAFAGGTAMPSLLPVQAGATASANIDANAGTSPLKIPYAAISTAGLTGDYHGTITAGPLTVSSGQSVDFLFSNPLSGAIAESNIQVLGPATVRPGSLRQDSIMLSDGTPIYRFTLDIPPLTANGSASLVFTSGSDILTRSGLLNLTLPQPVSASSFRSDR